jgi:hypothetical protein
MKIAKTIREFKEELLKLPADKEVKLVTNKEKGFFTIDTPANLIRRINEGWNQDVSVEWQIEDPKGLEKYETNKRKRMRSKRALTVSEGTLSQKILDAVLPAFKHKLILEIAQTTKGLPEKAVYEIVNDVVQQIKAQLFRLVPEKYEKRGSAIAKIASKLLAKGEVELAKAVLTLAEAEAFDTHYIQQGFKSVAADDEEPNSAAFITWIADRLNQSYPDGDVTMRVLIDLAQEPQARHLTRDLDWRGLLEYAWQAIGGTESFGVGAGMWTSSIGGV